MSAATDGLENGLLSLLFENANYANVGDATGLIGSTTPGVFYVSLHTASAGDTGNQGTNETVYTNYLRSGGSVVRSTAGWTVAAGNVDNDAAITYATCGATGATISHFGIGHSSTGAGTLHIHGDVNPDLIVNNGITPSFGIGALDITLA